MVVRNLLCLELYFGATKSHAVFVLTVLRKLISFRSADVTIEWSLLSVNAFLLRRRTWRFFSNLAFHRIFNRKFLPIIIKIRLLPNNFALLISLRHKNAAVIKMRIIGNQLLTFIVRPPRWSSGRRSCLQSRETWFKHKLPWTRQPCTVPSLKLRQWAPQLDTPNRY